MVKNSKREELTVIKTLKRGREIVMENRMDRKMGTFLKKTCQPLVTNCITRQKDVPERSRGEESLSHPERIKLIEIIGKTRGGEALENKTRVGGR